MKVLFDNQIFKIQNFGGVSRYFAELIKGLNDSPDFQAVPEKFYSTNKHLRVNKLTHFDFFSNNISPSGRKPIHSFLKKRDDKRILETITLGKYDIFHPTYYNPFWKDSLPAGKPFVLTVFDMIHELYFDTAFERTHDETLHKRQLVPHATHIVAISQNTKDDLLRFYPELDEKDITVIHLGSSFSSENSNPDLSLPSHYLLYVGNRNFYKNFPWFLRAIAEYLRSNNIVLVCAGGGDFTEKEIALFEKEEVSQSVKHVAVHDDKDLAALYKKAAAFIFPSSYEGFGIPILEAFACQCPVVLPDSSCFPEVAGDAALFYHHDDPSALVEKITSLVNDQDLSSHLREAGLNRLQLFNWSNTVEQHKVVYEKILSA